MNRQIRVLAIFAAVIVITGVAYIYFAEPWGPPGGNAAWSRADHNGDGIVERHEMERFGNQKPHRNVARLMSHFDAADVNNDQRVTQQEIDVYGTEIGSRDPLNRK